MNDTGSTLLAHCGARKVTREELKEIPVPEGTSTHQPLAHYKIVEVLEEALSFRSLEINRDEYAVSGDGMRMFGVMDLNFGFDGANFSIGLRNANDKSMRLALTAGYRVFVCDNMAFSGDFTPLLQKHTRRLELRDSISIAVDRICRGFVTTERQVRAMKEFGLTDNDARLFIYRVFMERAVRGLPRRLMPVVHDLYFDPTHEAFTERNLGSLSNAFTSAFKELAPLKQFEVTARLGSYLKQVRNDMKLRSEELPDLDGKGEDDTSLLALPERTDRLSLVPGGDDPHGSSVTEDDEFSDKEHLTDDPYDETGLPDTGEDSNHVPEYRSYNLTEELARKVAA